MILVVFFVLNCGDTVYFRLYISILLLVSDALRVYVLWCELYLSTTRLTEIGQVAHESDQVQARLPQLLVAVAGNDIAGTFREAARRVQVPVLVERIRQDVIVELTGEPIGFAGAVLLLLLLVLLLLDHLFETAL